RMQMGDGQASIPVAPNAFVTPAVAALPQAQALPVIPYGGYGPARLFAELRGTVVDFAVDGAGNVYLLVREDGAFRVHRLNPAGKEEAVWQAHPPGGRNLSGIAVTPQGMVFLTTDRVVLPHDRNGRPLAQWVDPPVWTPEIAFLPDGRMLSSLPDQ